MIRLSGVSKIYNSDKVVNEVSFSIEEGEVMVLLGTSGSGKTTLLKMINRLVEYDEGKISFDGVDIKSFDLISHRRGIGYVIQNSGLFPHMTVLENISVVPKLLKWGTNEIQSTAKELLSMLKLDVESTWSKYPDELSGGQKQRVGIARGLAGSPKVLLMDEPFGALDPITRSNVRKDFKELLKKKKTTTIIVTHDILEAIELADRICLLDHGKIQQIGTPKELLFAPENEFVAQFFESDRFQAELSAVTTSELNEDITNGFSVLEQLKGEVNQLELLKKFYTYKSQLSN